ncbi:Tim17-domain-containing protein [Sistotremastrum niveocremeum HHB9708]|uniref:Mitochondrial import inner membrane translocase subunit TIM22 n=1 Tax=Sistotremastrum niveocremeum HHB9708 TaxID=1314777 RepID=A0A164MZV8_9AGAM|nr:Tim17-domain-containing protein [Sistotremastrum niveocremeum HHB9708]
MPLFPNGIVPLYPAGSEPLPPGIPESDREAWNQQMKMQKWIGVGMESCVAKCVMAGAGGVVIGAFISLMSSSFAYEDPLLRAQAMENAQKAAAAKASSSSSPSTSPSSSSSSPTAGARDVFLEMGRGMYRSGKGFGKVGALFAGLECVVEGYRAKNDMINPVAAGFIAGGILARNSGPKAAAGGAVAFAAFSAVIDLFLRREVSE